MASLRLAAPERWAGGDDQKGRHTSFELRHSFTPHTFPKLRGFATPSLFGYASRHWYNFPNFRLARFVMGGDENTFR